MKLRYSATSPYVRKVMMVIHERGLSDKVELEKTDAWSPETDLPHDNPLGKVPALALGDGPALFDSPVIVEYLDTPGKAVPATALLPGRRPDRWAALRFQALADGICDAAILRRLEGNRPEQLRSTDWMERQRAAVARSVDALEADAEAERAFHHRQRGRAGRPWLSGLPLRPRGLAAGPPCPVGMVRRQIEAGQLRQNRSAGGLNAMDELTADQVIKLLGMQKHPEGGHYVETFREKPADGSRGSCTAIYYLLPADEFSAWHRVDAVEIWHWYAGGPLGADDSPNGHDADAIHLGPALGTGRGRRPWCRPAHGRRRFRSAHGRWSAAPCRRLSSSPGSNWLLAGLAADAETCRRKLALLGEPVPAPGESGP